MTAADENRWIPSARPAECFTATEITGGDVVLFDGDRLVYHTLNPSAYAVWQLCDGHRSVKVIAQMLATSCTPLTPEAVELALIDLADAGLLVGVASVADHVSRRQVLKSATAATLGVAMVPVVQSVTAPTSASAQTTCSYSGQCSSNCCANGADIIPQCANLLHAAYGYPASPSWSELSLFCSTQGLPADTCVASGGSQSVTHGPHTVNVPFSCK